MKLSKIMLIAATMLGFSLSVPVMAKNETTVIFTAKLIEGSCLQSVKSVDCNKNINGKRVSESIDISKMLKNGENKKISGTTTVLITKVDENRKLVQVFED